MESGPEAEHAALALADRVYRDVLRSIIEGETAPGAWLKERELSERFDKVIPEHVRVPAERLKAALATLPADRVPTSRDWARLSAGWRDDLEERILHLQRLRDNLADCIGCGCLSLRSCALSNPADVLAGQGPGPVRL